MNWLLTLIGYVEKERESDDGQMPEIKRGDIVWVELGFNVGKEFGGSHPAIALRDCKQGVDQVLVLPFGSQKPTRNLPIYVEFPNIVGLTGHLGIGSDDPDKGKHWANILGIRNVSRIRVTYQESMLRADDRILDRISGAIVSQIALRASTRR